MVVAAELSKLEEQENRSSVDGKVKMRSSREQIASDLKRELPSHNVKVGSCAITDRPDLTKSTPFNRGRIGFSLLGTSVVKKHAEAQT